MAQTLTRWFAAMVLFVIQRREPSWTIPPETQSLIQLPKIWIVEPHALMPCPVLRSILVSTMVRLCPFSDTIASPQMLNVQLSTRLAELFHIRIPTSVEIILLDLMIEPPPNERLMASFMRLKKQLMTWPLALLL